MRTVAPAITFGNAAAGGQVTGPTSPVDRRNQFITVLNNVTPQTWCSGTVHNMWGNHTATTAQTRANSPINANQVVAGTNPRGWSFPAHNPCPPGWRIPSRWEWGDMVGGNATGNGYHATGAAGATLGTVNHWVWRAADADASARRGVGGRIMQRPDTSAQVFLPAVGQRNRATPDEIGFSGGHGWFWSSTPAGTENGWRLRFDSTEVRAAATTNNSRASAQSVRCIQ